MDGIKKILGSFKGVAFLLLLAAITAMVMTGKATVEQFNELVKWAFGTVVVARAGEEGMKGLGGGNADITALVKKLAAQAMGKAKPPADDEEITADGEG